MYHNCPDVCPDNETAGFVKPDENTRSPVLQPDWLGHSFKVKTICVKKGIPFHKVHGTIQRMHQVLENFGPINALSRLQQKRGGFASNTGYESILVNVQSDSGQKHPFLWRLNQDSSQLSAFNAHIVGPFQMNGSSRDQRRNRFPNRPTDGQGEVSGARQRSPQDYRQQQVLAGRRLPGPRKPAAPRRLVICHHDGPV
jgi:hypothetical protein